MKQRIPWPLRFAIKLLIGITHVDYRILKRAHLVEHGRMDHEDFSTAVFNSHVVQPRTQWGTAATGALLELGPGDSVATGVLGRASGFPRVVLVDVGAFADLRPVAINRLYELLGDAAHRIPESATRQQVLADLEANGISYRTDGLEALRRLPAGSVAQSFSNSVLQHVERHSVAELAQRLGTVHAAGSLSSHLINFTDHFSGGFVNHTLPDWVMESRLIKRANLYTNRVPVASFLDLFEAAGFALRRAAVDFFDRDGPDRTTYESAAELRRGTAARRLLRVVFVLQKT